MNAPSGVLPTLNGPFFDGCSGALKFAKLDQNFTLHFLNSSIGERIASYVVSSICLLLDDLKLCTICFEYCSSSLFLLFIVDFLKLFQIGLVVAVDVLEGCKLGDQEN